MLERVGIVVIVAGCGGIADLDANVDAANETGRVDATADVEAEAAIAEAGDASPIDMGDCGNVVQPTELADAKDCPYQAGGASTCALGDYCCEPPTGNATCGKPCDVDAGYTVKCSSKNMGCVDSPCCIDAVFERMCGGYEATPASTYGTICGGSSGTTLHCPPGTGQVCATSSECIGGGTCVPLAVLPTSEHPIWLGVCVGTDGNVVIAP